MTPKSQNPDSSTPSSPASTSSPEPAAPPSARPRMVSPDRQAAVQIASTRDKLIPGDHHARVVWLYVQQMDLTPLYDRIRSRGSRAGRPATDPALFVALWLFATLEGVSSARQLNQLCREHFAYLWLCGGVAVNYHSLSDFRVAHGKLLEKLLVDGVARLMAGGLVDMARVAQDGVRVRAHAGGSSFRRRETLENMREKTQEKATMLNEETPSEPASKQRAAQIRGASDLAQRLDAALEHMTEVEKKPKKSRKKAASSPQGTEQFQTDEKARQEKKDARRVSVTDPEARVMKMADGGFRPAYNCQFATDVKTRVVVGVGITNIGTDKAQAGVMAEQLESNYDRLPGMFLFDNGFVRLDVIEKLEEQGVEVVAPVQRPRWDRDPYAPQPGDGKGVAAWRQRMGTEKAKLDYRQRASVAECVNAHTRRRGLYQFPVRGLEKCKAILLWQALAQNLRRALTLAAEIALG